MVLVVVPAAQRVEGAGRRGMVDPRDFTVGKLPGAIRQDMCVHWRTGEEMAIWEFPGMGEWARPY